MALEAYPLSWCEVATVREKGEVVGRNGAIPGRPLPRPPLSKGREVAKARPLPQTSWFSA